MLISFIYFLFIYFFESYKLLNDNRNRFPIIALSSLRYVNVLCSNK